MDTAMKETVLPEKFLESKLIKYKEILRLNDWDIELHEMNALDSMASTKLVFNEYTAVIEMSKELNDKNKEVTLIHELLHLIFRDEVNIIQEYVENEQLKELCLRMHERSIDRLAHVLYKTVNA